MAIYLLLLPNDSALEGTRIDVVGEIVVGREDAELVVDDDEVSRRHACFRSLLDGELEVEDLGSRNGTLVNGELIQGRRRLVVGDGITVGQTLLRVQTDVVATDAEAARRAPLSPFPRYTASPHARKRIASRRQMPTVLTFATIIATAVALVVYFAVH